MESEIRKCQKSIEEAEKSDVADEEQGEECEGESDYKVNEKSAENAEYDDEIEEEDDYNSE